MLERLTRPLHFSSLLLIGILCLGSTIAFAQSVTVTHLTIESRENPLGLDVRQPRFGWVLATDERDVVQTAYHILVASSAEKLANGEGDLWDSGKVASAQSGQVPYAGRPLESRMPCHVKVKVWTNRGETTWSAPAHWTMGLLYYKDWRGRWIGFDHPFPWDSIATIPSLSARYFRKEFQPKKEVASATAYIMGLGLYELYLNGQKIGDQVLAPTPTDYTENVKYNTFDVTEAVVSGDNAIGVTLGNGRYFTMRQNYKPYKIKNFGFPKLLLQLELTYTDGSTEVIKTDGSWKGTADGPIRNNNEYDGEFYDARKEMPGWNRAGFDDRAWLAAEYVQEPRGDFEAQLNPNMKVMDSLKPVSLRPLAGNRYVLDLGQNMVGWLKMRVEGTRGDTVHLRFAESLQDNGDLFVANLRDARATDTYVLKGGGEEVWEPSFTYHGFRYVEISGYPGTPSVDDFVGQFVYDDIATTGTFESSDPLLNQLFRNAWWGIAGNYKGMPVDCPQRNERQPWLGDRAIGAYGESFLFDNQLVYAKWLDDIRLSQRADGALPDVAPAFWRYYSDNMTWPGTLILVAQMLYRQYGDRAAIAENYPAMKQWLAYMQERYMTEAFIVTKDSYGDWCVPPVSIEAGRGKSADQKHPSALISTAYYYHFMQLMTDFAHLLGEEKDAAAFQALGGQIKEAFNREFYHPDRGYYDEGQLTSNLLPLAFGLVPEANCEQVFDEIVKTIEVEHQGHLSSGLIGTQWLMRGLTENGRPDLAYQLATNTTYPSWGYMVEHGATTIWELWNGNTAAPSMNSQNHVMLLGDLLIWYYEHLAGIKSDDEAVAFRKIIMNPYFPDDLRYVNASYQSVQGLIRSHWQKSKNRLTWDITIPANTSARVYLPTDEVKNIKVGNAPLNQVPAVRVVGTENGKTVLDVASGHYQFTIRNPR
ncbi:alpha-L-rhamnosidase [Catalinimonas alkaloidigena]|uniref:alpha-L-rhamnosidase n=1 Tax=Catalinimonas alkaloidigena TaxID=1075417 RepID=A0A1G9SCS1_9BACT|nr:alpha-L-rhamnosidase [Catalinimonas alkaloidigena]SDM33268.1 alpha-L-rhamnosidase [Catalinimonas alkaloidigena]